MKLGDYVSVLDEDVSGKVVSIVGNKITIIDLDGFQQQYLKNELVFQPGELSDLANSIENISEIISEKEQKKHNFYSKVKSKKRTSPQMEVDLHIHQLVSNTRNMDNFEMLNFQLETARRKIAFAITKKIQKIVFIHGVGEGVLKYELIRVLKEYEGRLKFYDADYQKYGLGATEVYIFKSKQ